MAIANPSQQLIMNTALASDLLLAKEGATERYINNVAEIKIQGKEQKKSNDIADTVDLPSGKKSIYEAVIKGNKKDILRLIKEELNINNSPGDIIDTALIPAINEVGRLYDSQKYFLPQLISGAETMKIAIEYLEPMLAKNRDSSESNGTIVIATVSGDIHDIGKNLVALMLKNHGYRVIDLGKDVSEMK